MKVSDIVKNQYKSICKTSCTKSNWDDGEIDYKIHRLVSLGKLLHTYENGTKIVRAHYMNFSISATEIMNMWVDRNADYININEKDKLDFDKNNGVRLNKLNAKEELSQIKNIISHLKKKIYREEVNLEREYQRYDKLQRALDEGKIS